MRQKAGAGRAETYSDEDARFRVTELCHSIKEGLHKSKDGIAMTDHPLVHAKQCESMTCACLRS
eukprot:137308-Pleurochrysis_carterae.AAC.1